MSSFILLTGVALVTVYFLVLAVKKTEIKSDSLKRESKRAYVHIIIGGILGALLVSIIFLVIASINNQLDSPFIYMSCFFYSWFGLVGGAILGLIVFRRLA